MLQTTPQERLALGVTALLLIAGTGVRVVTLRDPGAQWEASGADTLEVDGLRGVRERVAVRAGLDSIAALPLGKNERIDPNRATLEELQRLPRVGPGLARRIVEWREKHGRFRTVADLDSLPGMGPTLLAAIAPHVALPAAPRGGGAGVAGAGRAASAAGPLDLNAASAAELEALPGVGPALAARIIAWRTQHGRFSSVAELDSVSGIGPALLAKLGPLLKARR